MTKTHGMSRHPLYGTWGAMMTRCYNQNQTQFKDWGGRGITVCDRWHDVRLFIQDIEDSIGPRTHGMTLDRIRNDRGYEPGNVRWATRLEQNRNSRSFVDGDRRGTLYASWWRIMHRCPDEICPQWRTWPSFRDDIARLLPPRQKGMRLDRIEDGKNYEPGNMTWLTGTQQIRRAQAARWAR